MSAALRIPPRHRVAALGVLLGAGYGLVVRLLVGMRLNSDWFGAMSVGFLVIVPIVIGFLAVRGLDRPSVAARLFMPWIACGLMMLAAMLLLWEGSICVIVAAPLILVLSSVGGLIGASRAARARGALPAMLALPFAAMPAERLRAPATRVVETVTETVVDAPPSRVWPLVVSVDSIRPAERVPALFTAIGIPEPVAATIDRAGVGAVRIATFDRGLAFHERVTAWEPDRRIAFAIRPWVIPDGTLDEHVEVGGRYFDVIDGEYELRALPGGRTQLVLRSRHRVSTAVNPYAAWWADRLMRSIQESILEVLRRRATSGAALLPRA